MTDTVTLRVERKTKTLLDKQKIHPRETYDDLINRILAEIITNKVLGIKMKEASK